MRLTLLVLLICVGPVFAGTSVITREGAAAVYGEVPHIPGDVLLGIKKRAELYHPGKPDLQTKVIWIGVEAYLELRRVPNTPAKKQAAEEFPYDYPKQLYLAQRPFWR